MVDAEKTRAEKEWEQSYNENGDDGHDDSEQQRPRRQQKAHNIGAVVVYGRYIWNRHGLLSHFMWGPLQTFWIINERTAWHISRKLSLSDNFKTVVLAIDINCMALCNEPVPDDMLRSDWITMCVCV